MGETNVDGHASMRAQRRMLPFPFLIALLWFTQQQTVGPTPTTTITISAAMSESNQRNYNSVKKRQQLL